VSCHVYQLLQDLFMEDVPEFEKILGSQRVSNVDFPNQIVESIQDSNGMGCMSIPQKNM